jgi:polyisoprenoid-binding protein YceI
MSHWTLDASHTNASFSVRHLMISNVKGQFTQLSGDADYDPAKPEAARISVSIDVASVHTREEKRDAHLRSPDFFDVERFPKMTFESKKVTKKGDGLAVEGELTIRGTTRPVVLEVEEITEEHGDPWGNRRIGATASTKIKRSDFGMTWNAALEAGGVVVGDEVKIHLDVELIKDK